MATDVQDRLKEILQSAAGNAANASAKSRKKGGLLSGSRGLAVGAGAAALAPLAAKGVGKLAKTVAGEGLGGAIKAPGQALQDLTSNVGDSVGGGLGDKVSDKLDEAGGPSGILKDTVKGVLPFGGGDSGGGKGGAPGVGKGRRMPVQQSVDIGAPIETVYNQWTQFEEWPTFMHRVTRVTQEDECTISFATKIWGKTKEFTAKIETQHPDERIKWNVSQGLTHRGVVTFHELGPNLTRVLLGMDVEPGGLLEKAARGMRHVKRAARADLHRFKALIEMSGQETGAWRGVIEDGELVEEHDPSYDEEREYADVEEITGQSDDEEETKDDEDETEAAASEDDEDEDEDEEPEEERRPQRRSARSRGSSKSSSGRSRRSRGHNGRSRSDSRAKRNA